jgi:small subunit ribosomal protein S13
VHIYGFGKFKSFFTCKRLGFSRNLKTKKLSREHINRLIKTIEHLNLKLASDLKKSNFLSMKKLVAMKSYRGSRKMQGLPARGQRTHTNAKTSRKRFR